MGSLERLGHRTTLATTRTTTRTTTFTTTFTTGPSTGDAETATDRNTIPGTSSTAHVSGCLVCLHCRGRRCMST